MMKIIQIMMMNDADFIDEWDTQIRIQILCKSMY